MQQALEEEQLRLLRSLSLGDVLKAVDIPTNEARERDAYCTCSHHAAGSSNSTSRARAFAMDELLLAMEANRRHVADRPSARRLGRMVAIADP